MSRGSPSKVVSLHTRAHTRHAGENAGGERAIDRKFLKATMYQAGTYSSSTTAVLYVHVLCYIDVHVLLSKVDLVDAICTPAAQTSFSDCMRDLLVSTTV